MRRIEGYHRSRNLKDDEQEQVDILKKIYNSNAFILHYRKIKSQIVSECGDIGYRGGIVTTPREL